MTLHGFYLDILQVKFVLSSLMIYLLAFLQYFLFSKFCKFFFKLELLKVTLAGFNQVFCTFFSQISKFFRAFLFKLQALQPILNCLNLLSGLIL